MTSFTKIDDCLSTRNGHLFLEECDTVDLVKQFGSPLFIFSEKQLRENVRSFRKGFSAFWPGGEVDVLPAIKANWILATRRILSEEGAGADIYSYGELHAALTAGVNPEIISVNGGGKQEYLIEKCIQNNVRITVEDLDEPDLINQVAARLGKKAKIRFRVKPNFPELRKPTAFAQEKVTIDIGIQVYKSGIPAQYLPELGKKVLQMSNLELVGLHFHGGRHDPSLWYWENLMRGYAALIAELSSAWGGWQPQEIDIGGGFAIYRDPHNKLGLRKDVVETWLTWPLVKLLGFFKPELRYKIMGKVLPLFSKKPNRKMAPTIPEYGQAAAGTLHRELSRLGINTKGVKLQIEPGRCLYGNSGIHVTRVKKVKQQTMPMPWNWGLTDTTYFFLAGGMYEYQFNDFIFANRTDDKPKYVADIVGHSCYGDRILPIVQVPDVQTGDLIAMLDMGAYQEVSACNFNALPRPATILVNGKDAEIIRRAETIEEVFRRDVIPERLIRRKNESA